MTALATLADLESYGIDVTDEQAASSLLDSVSDAVRSAAGCPITFGGPSTSPESSPGNSTCPAGPSEACPRCSLTASP